MENNEIEKDENYSSLEQSIDLITFVGEKDHLVSKFMTRNLEVNPRHIYIFTSDYIKDPESKTTQIMNKMKNVLNNWNTDIETVMYIVKDIWDISYYYKSLKSLPDNKYIINISAGPSVFSSAAMLWSLETNNQISYSVEQWENRILTSCIFRNLNMKPFSLYYFKSDNIDRYIIHSLESGRDTSVKMKDFIETKWGFKTSLRNIQEHIRKLYEFGILDVGGGKEHIIDFSGDFKKLGYDKSPFPL